jgi:hypothetical protein
MPGERSAGLRVGLILLGAAQLYLEGLLDRDGLLLA